MGREVTPLVIFTDLDDTLLDHDTYSFDAARPALDTILRRGIPLVPCTSKTAAETRLLMEALGVHGSFIVEGGGGVYLPRGRFADLPFPVEDRGSFVLLPMSARHSEVWRGFARLKQLTGDSIRGFSDMPVDEVARRTGLPPERAALAALREFDEPFIFVRREEEFAPRLAGMAGDLGLTVSRGGRFHHLHGDTDKGRAVTLVAALYRSALGTIRTVGLGDSEQDLPMLAAVDVPVAIARMDGSHHPALVAGLPGLRKAGRGPAGWSEAVLATIGDDCRPE